MLLYHQILDAWSQPLYTETHIVKVVAHAEKMYLVRILTVLTAIHARPSCSTLLLACSRPCHIHAVPPAPHASAAAQQMHPPLGSSGPLLRQAASDKAVMHPPSPAHGTAHTYPHPCTMTGFMQACTYWDKIIKCTGTCLQVFA